MKVFEAIAEVESIEDGGSAIILGGFEDIDEEHGIVVRVQSWDERADSPDRHADIKKLIGKKVRITLEIL